MIGSEKVEFNNEMCLAQQTNADKDYCLLYMMQESGALVESVKVKEILEFYTQTCNIELTIE